MKLLKDPNFSIIVPGGCNRHCKFCFYKQGNDELSWPDYKDRLKEVLETLPKEFWQVSITGGEPTLNERLVDILKIVRPRFEKVVLTTNATNCDLVNNFTIKDLVDHINISRHHWSYSENKQIFGGIHLPGDDEIRCMADEFSHLGIDLNINCVLHGQFQNSKDILEFIDHCRNAWHARSVCFRHEFMPTSNLEPTGLELAFTEHKVIAESKCPVCRSTSQYIKGMIVTWKSAMTEPSSNLDEIYELVFHPNGILSIDWATKIPVIWNTGLSEYQIERGWESADSEYPKSVQALNSGIREPIAKDPRVDELKERLAKLEAELSELRNKQELKDMPWINPEELERDIQLDANNKLYDYIPNSDIQDRLQKLKTVSNDEIIRIIEKASKVWEKAIQGIVHKSSTYRHCGGGGC